MTADVRAHATLSPGFVAALDERGIDPIGETTQIVRRICDAIMRRGGSLAFGVDERGWKVELSGSLQETFRGPTLEVACIYALLQLDQVLEKRARLWPAPLPCGPAELCVRMATLSPREGEVLRHLADLHSNAEIGDYLFISPHTVARHVDNIRAKLGVRSRAEAAFCAIWGGFECGGPLAS